MPSRGLPPPSLRQWVKEALNIDKGRSSPHESAVLAVMESLTAKAHMGGSDMMLLEYTSGNAEVSQRMLATVVDTYEQIHIEVNRSQMPPEFFTKKAKDWKDRLDAKEKELADFLKKYKFTSLQSQKELLLARVDAAEVALGDTSISMTSIRARISAREANLKDEPRHIEDSMLAGTRNSVPDQLQRQLLELRMEEAALSSRFTEKGSDELVNVREQIRQTEDMLSGQSASPMTTPVKRSNPNYETLRQLLQNDQVALAAEQAAARELSGELKTVQEQLAQLVAREKEYTTLQREVSMLEREYTQNVSSLHVAEFSATLDRDRITNIQVLQNATLPIMSSKNSSKLLLLLAAGSLGGLILGLGAAFILEMFDHSLRTDDQVERHLGIPVLVTLPRVRQFRVDM